MPLQGCTLPFFTSTSSVNGKPPRKFLVLSIWRPGIVLRTLLDAKRCTGNTAIHAQHKERREISGVGSENYAQFQLVFPQSKLDLEGLDVVASLSNELVFTFWPK